MILDERLVALALRFGEASSKRELVHMALSECIRRREARGLMDRFGTGGIDADYDDKAARAGDREPDAA